MQGVPTPPIFSSFFLFSSGPEKPVVVYSYLSFYLKNLYLFAYFEHVKKFMWWSASDLTSQRGALMISILQKSK